MSDLDMQVYAYMRDHHPIKYRQARDRTTSYRKRAGSRKGNHGLTALSDYRRQYEIGRGMKPNHAARFQEIRDLFPSAPGQGTPIKRWP